MSVTTAPTPVIAGRSWTHVTRAAVLAVAFVALLAVSFVVGRTTVSTAKQAPAVVTKAASATNWPTTTYPCRMGRAC